jgi:hypothetical protein
MTFVCPTARMFHLQNHLAAVYAKCSPINLNLNLMLVYIGKLKFILYTQKESG